MATKEPVLLVVLIEPGEFRWWVAGISLTGEPLPLLRSEAGSLRDYLDLPFDEQVSFLRHRLCGVLQRGCDRLWGLMKKPCRIVFIADGPFPDASSELTPRVAEHFALWMTSPGVAFFLSSPFGGNVLPLTRLAGEMPAEQMEALQIGLPQLMEQMQVPEAWELAAGKK